MRQVRRSTKKAELQPVQAVPQEQLPQLSISLKELFNERDRYTVYPRFQRQEVWTLKQNQALIDTILLGDPIPPLEGHEEYTEQGAKVWRLSNGHQRTSAILDFMSGKYKTWTAGQKRTAEPNSTFAPVEPGRFFDELPVHVKNYFLDYRIRVDRVRNRPEPEQVTRFLRIQNQVPLTAGEKLNAYASKAKDAAQRIEQHPFWEDFYAGKTTRKQLFQSSLYLLALEMTPGGMRDLKSGNFSYKLALGSYDDEITDALVDAVLARLDVVSTVYSGTLFTIRSVVIAMYQSILFLEQAGYTFQQRDKGKLTNWIMGIINESSHASMMPNFNRTLPLLAYKSAQDAFWQRHLKTILVMFGLHEKSA